MALTLTRQENQSILIKVKGGEVIRLEVNQITGTTVSLSFEASDNVLVLREEVPDRNQPERP